MTPTQVLAAKLRFLLKQIERGEQKLNPIRGETEGAPPIDMAEELRRALGDYDNEQLTKRH